MLECYEVMTLLLVVTIIYIVSITILFIYCYKVKKVQRAADRNRRILIDHATALLIKQNILYLQYAMEIYMIQGLP